MEKKFLKYLLKSTSFSVPSSSNNHKANFSGLLVPKEARRNNTDNLQEPTSPKVSCIGTVKKKNKNGSNTKKDKDETKKSVIKRMFTMKGKAAVKERVAPERGVMRKFVSGRESLRDFDWRKAMEEDEEEDDGFSVAHSGPILMGGGEIGVEKRKEVNLWKRTASLPPVPLKLKSAFSGEDEE